MSAPSIFAGSRGIHESRQSLGIRPVVAKQMIELSRLDLLRAITGHIQNLPVLAQLVHHHGATLDKLDAKRLLRARWQPGGDQVSVQIAVAVIVGEGHHHAGPMKIQAQGARLRRETCHRPDSSTGDWAHRRRRRTGPDRRRCRCRQSWRRCTRTIRRVTPALVRDVFKPQILPDCDKGDCRPRVVSGTRPASRRRRNRRS